jgi:sugar (pentulose or hexulose) kinase
MNNPLVLTIDFGTQSVRAIIFNKKGEAQAMSKKRYEPTYFSNKPGQAEQDSKYYWKRMCEATQELTQKHPELIKQIVASSLTCFRDTAVLLDEKLQIVRPSILWLDQRLAKLESFGLFRTVAFYLTGLLETAKLNSRRTMAIWIRQNEPENWKKTKYYVNISTYFTYKLVGQLIDSSANQIGHYPIDFKRGKWYRENALKAPIFKIPRKMLCTLVQPGEQLGKITKEAAEETGLPEGLIIYAAGADKGAETIGTGCLTPDKASLSYGTASSIEITNSRYIEPEPFLPAYQAIVPGFYNLEMQIYRGYWMISWFIQQFADKESTEALIEKMAVEEVLNKELATIPPGSEGLVLQPYWGPALSRPEAKGAIIGWSDAHTRMHMYRAIIEGIAFAMKEGLDLMEKRQHQKINEIRVSGGGSQSDVICQITADIFNRPVSRVQTYETASLGTAVAAFVAHKEFSNYTEALEAMVHVSKTFVPNKEAQKKYDYLYRKVYLKLYGKLLSIYRRIGKFNHK